MRFLLDAGLPRSLADWLRGQGHDSIHAHDIGLARAPDIDLLRLAFEQRRVLVTLDLDFAEIVAFSGGLVVSVVLLRLARPTKSGVIDRLLTVLPATAAALEAGAIVVVEEARHRIRRLPIGS